MRLQSIRVQNYRSIRDATLTLDDLTALVGANGVGKSTFFKAMSLFYDPAPRVAESDCHCRNDSEPIVLTATFAGLSEQARDRFSPYVQGETLVVERIIRIKDGSMEASYHGSRLRCPDFQDFWSQKSASLANTEYAKIRKKEEYKGFPPLRNYDERKAYLEQWEIDHPDRCVRVRDEEQFFGFKGVGRGYLGHFTKFLLIEAVHDASSDEREARGSALGEIMEMAVRADFDTSGLQDIREEMGERVRDFMSREKVEDRLSGLGAELTKALHTYVPDGEIELDLERMPDVHLELPKAVAKLVEDAYKTDVQGAGHGLQRAFIMAVLGYLASARRRPASGGAEAQPAPGLVLCIEEPELYQHPNRQRHMAEALLRLSKKGEVGEPGRTQVVYATHSPHFVGIDRIDQIRLIKKESGGAGRHTAVSQTSLGRIAGELEAKATGRRKAAGRFTAETLAARLQAIMTPWMNEGFFSGAVVLVEGEADRAVITGYLSAIGSRADSMDISVIPCGGKANIDRPALIFRHLGIPTYVIWDCDKHKKDERDDASNRMLMSLFGREYTEPCRLVEADFACFEDDMTETLKREFGPPFSEALSKNARDLGFDTKRAMKNAHAIAKTISSLKAGGLRSDTLEEIMEKILRLPPHPTARPGSGGAAGAVAA